MPEGELDYQVPEEPSSQEEFERELLNLLQDLVNRHKDRMHLGSMITHLSLVVETLDQAGSPCIRLFSAPDDRLSSTMAHAMYLDTITRAQLLRMRHFLPVHPTNTINGETQ